MTEDSTQWLVQLHEQQGQAVLYRMALLLGAGDQAHELVHDSFRALHRRAHRVIDPAERIEFLQESVVHLSRSARGTEGEIRLPRVEDPAQNQVLEVVEALPVHLSEHLIVSHYLARFGPELAGIMRMTIRRSNRRLETALMAVHRELAEEGGLDATADDVMAALRASARAIHPPSADEFEAELAELPQRERMRFPSKIVVVIAAVALIVGFVVATMTRGLTSPLIDAGPQQPAANATQRVQTLPALVLGVPVYYVGRKDGLLYPELRDLPASGQLVRSALEAVFSLAPLDPDYRSVWSPGQLLGVELQGSYLTVDLSASAYEELEGQEAMQAINQVVHTANNLIGAPELRVRFLADGGLPPAPFEQVEGFTHQGLAPVAPVRIVSPKNLAQAAAGDVELRGEVHPDYGLPEVTITDTGLNRIIVQRSVTRSEEANQRGWDEWSLIVSLPVGDYDISVVAGDDLERPAPLSVDNKLIQVR